MLSKSNWGACDGGQWYEVPKESVMMARRGLNVSEAFDGIRWRLFLFFHGVLVLSLSAKIQSIFETAKSVCPFS